MKWVFCSWCKKRFKMQESDEKRRRGQNIDGAIYHNRKCADAARKNRTEKKMGKR